MERRGKGGCPRAIVERSLCGGRERSCRNILVNSGRERGMGRDKGVMVRRGRLRRQGVKRDWVEWHYKENFRDFEADNKVVMSAKVWWRC